MKQLPEPTGIRWRDFEFPATQYEATENARTRVAWRLTRVLSFPRLHEGEAIDPARHKVPKALLTDRIEELITKADEIGANTVYPDDPQNGCEYLWGLVHPAPKHRAEWPSPFQIANYESKAIRNALAIMSRTHSAITVFNTLIRKYFLTEPEARSLILLAKKQARTFVESEDPEEARSLMILRTQQVAAKAAKAFNTREEMNALKLESQLRGLTRTDNPADGILDVFAKVIGEAATSPHGVRDLGHAPEHTPLIDFDPQTLDNLHAADTDDT